MSLFEQLGSVLPAELLSKKAKNKYMPNNFELDCGRTIVKYLLESASLNLFSYP